MTIEPLPLPVPGSISSQNKGTSLPLTIRRAAPSLEMVTNRANPPVHQHSISVAS